VNVLVCGRRNKVDKMQRLILKRIKKKSDMPKLDTHNITNMVLNNIRFCLFLDSDDRYFLEGNKKIYEIVNKID
jgi:hypothetical protein